MKKDSLNRNFNYIKALTKLKQKGIRPTSQRKVLAKIIFENGNRHLNAEIIYNEAKKLGHSISLATVYNTLKQFSYFGLLKEIVVDQNKSMYCNNREPHYHLYVEDEGKIIDIPNDNIDLSNIPEILACLNLHNIDIIVRIRTLKQEQS